MLTQDLLNEIFTYDPETGKLERNNPYQPTRGIGTAASYSHVTVNGKSHKIHRIIWLMLHGHIPKGMVIDHTNGDTTDNRLCNLRLATHQENMMNSGLRKCTKSGFKGVSVIPSGFRSDIRVGGKTKLIGCFKSVEEAAAAYDKAAVEHYGQFARTNMMLGLLPNTSSNA